jgi:hypothetical protein
LLHVSSHECLYDSFSELLDVTCPEQEKRTRKKHLLEEINLSCAQLYTVTLKMIRLLLWPTHIHHILNVIQLPTHIHHILNFIWLTMLIF